MPEALNQSAADGESASLSALRNAWAQAGADLALHPQAWEAVFDDSITRHSEPHRRYHTPKHLVAVDRSLRLITPTVDAVFLAATLLHDVIYDVTRSDNETRSAAFAVPLLSEAGMPARSVAAVAEIIEATAAHAVPERPRVADRVVAFLDADLSILGADPETYQRYAADVRVEYQHVPDADFRTGRAKILRSFLTRDTLFFTAPGQALWETSARENLAREIATLDGQTQ